jgi:hypothetical protein
MASGNNKEIHPQGKPAKTWRHESKPYQRDRARKEGSEKQGVCESAVAPEVTVTDAESEPNDVKIGNDGAERADNPDSLWRASAVETNSDPKGCDRM